MEYSRGINDLSRGCLISNPTDLKINQEKSMLVFIIQKDTLIIDTG